MFAEQEPKLHSAIRKRVANAYSMSSILRYEPYIQQCLDLCFSKFKRYTEREEAADLSVWTSALAFDIVGELGYGQDLGHMKTESDVNGLRAMIVDGFKMVSTLGHFPGQSYLVTNPVVAAITEALGGETAFAKLDVWVLKRINARRNDPEGADRPDMLFHFMNMKSLDSQGLADDKKISTESGILIGAGADTTSYEMSTCLYHLCSHPDAYKRLQNEVDNFYTKTKLSEPISYNQSQEMPYLKAVVAETLRISPTLPFQLLRYSSQGGLSIDGHYIPAGYSIGMSALAQNHDKAVFGEDADKFRPERWLESPEQASIMERANMVRGGNGPRVCIGKNIALVELNKFIAQLLRNFDIELESVKKQEVTTHWFSHQHNMTGKLTLRPNATMREVKV